MFYGILLNTFFFMYLSGAGPGFFLGGGAPQRNGVADWWILGGVGEGGLHTH